MTSAPPPRHRAPSPSVPPARFPPRFIVFEGVDGVGKTTQIRMLHEHLVQQGIATLATQEPAPLTADDDVRALLAQAVHGKWHSALGQALAFYADRAEHIATTIKPALARHEWVLCDRFADSTSVYQHAVGAACLHELRRLTLLAAGVSPDLTIVLRVDPQVIVERWQQRSLLFANAQSLPSFEQGYNYAEADQRQARYLALAANQPDYVVINGDLDRQAIANEIAAVVRRRFLASDPVAPQRAGSSMPTVTP